MNRISSSYSVHDRPGEWRFDNLSGSHLQSQVSESLDSEDDFRSGCRNVSHQQQFFSELHSPGRSHYTNYWYSWVQTIYYE